MEVTCRNLLSFQVMIPVAQLEIVGMGQMGHSASLVMVMGWMQTLADQQS